MNGFKLRSLLARLWHDSEVVFRLEDGTDLEVSRTFFRPADGVTKDDNGTEHPISPPKVTILLRPTVTVREVTARNDPVHVQKFPKLQPMPVPDLEPDPDEFDGSTGHFDRSLPGNKPACHDPDPETVKNIEHERK